jgi:hypothetical protein
MRNAWSMACGVAVVLLTAGGAQAAQYYVRTDGSDACSGLSNAAGSSGSCAFKTIAKCEATAVCGDTCNVGAGDFYETTKLTVTDQCTATTKKRIVGAGPNATTVYFQLLPSITCTKRTGSTYVYECTVPASGVTNSSTADPSECFVQTLGTGRIDLEPKNGRDQSYRNSICLTPAASESSIDANDDDAADSILDSPAGEGFWVHTTGSTKYAIHPFGNMAPSASVRFHPPTATAGGDWVTFDRAKYVTVENFKVLQGRIYAGDYAVGLEIRNVVSYHAGLWVGLSVKGTNQSQGLVVANTRILQQIHRIRNKGCGLLGNPCNSTSDFTSGTACVIRGKGTVVDGLECYSGGEGLVFGGEGQSIRKAVAHGFYNHGCKVNERYEDSVMENLVCYNNQEGMHWANCQKNILIRHATIDGTVLMQGQYDPNVTCADGSATGQWNIDFFNSNIAKISFNDPYGMDPRAGARGFDSDYNVYFSPDTIFSHMRPDPAPNTLMSTVAEWQNYSGDTCTNCIRDPHSVKTSRTSLFQNSSGADLDSALADFVLRTGAPSFELGNPSYITSDGKDCLGFTRVGRPDSGAYEFGGSTTAVCGNGSIEGAEQCDGTSLNGATCQSVVGGAGVLLCSSTCTFNTTDCGTPIAPPSVVGVQRTDVLP